MSRRKRNLYLLLLTLLICAWMTGGVSAAPSAAPGSTQEASAFHTMKAACRNSVRLTPGETPGFWWQDHRYYLAINFQYSGKYVIANQTYYQLYDWSRWGFYGNTTRFGVPTSYVLTHPAWKSEYWLLLYNC